MTSERRRPALAKWPFVVGDILLLVLAYIIATQSPDPFALWPLVFTFLAVATGAWLCTVPFLAEYRGQMKLNEVDGLTSAAAQFRNLQDVTNQIGLATGQWQSIQELCTQTVASAQVIADRISKEARAFSEFMAKASDTEKNHLRLEVEKLRRGEGEWLQTLVRLLDHVHALYQAGVRSGQANVREQLGNFQAACRDVVRRIGLVALDADAGELFDPNRHQLVDGHPAPPPEPRIAEVVASGFSFQGQLLRRIVVTVEGESPEPAAELATEETDEEAMLPWDKEPS